MDVPEFNVAIKLTLETVENTNVLQKTCLSHSETSNTIKYSHLNEGIDKPIGNGMAFSNPEHFYQFIIA